MEPKAVAIVTCGNEHVKELKKLLGETHYAFSISKWDLRNELTEYRAKDVAWAQDSNNAQTASAVYAISQFPYVVITIVNGAQRIDLLFAVQPGVGTLALCGQDRRDLVEQHPDW